MPDVGIKYSFFRGDTAGIDGTPVVDGQILFDKERQRIALDAIVDGALTRIIMTEKDTFTGTQAQWEALTDAQKAIFTYVNILDDYEFHSDVFVGATDSTDGQVGLVTRPMAGDQGKYLKGDGTWSPVELPEDMTGATSSTAGTHGLVPAPSAGNQEKYLKGDGTWADVPGRTTYSSTEPTSANTGDIWIG